LRTGDIRSVPLGVWLFGALTLLYLGVLITDQAATGNLLLLPTLLITQLGPLVFATVVAFVVPADRRILWAAALIAVPSILLMLTLIVRRTPGASSWRSSWLARPGRARLCAPVVWVGAGVQRRAPLNGQCVRLPSGGQLP
jgi:hypothetical protein